MIGRLRMGTNGKGTLPKITIEMMPNGSVTINGPLHDKILCFGLLKMAEILVAEYKPENQRQIVIPQLKIAPKPSQ